MKIYQFLDFTFDTNQHALFKSGTRLDIGSIAYDLLLFFLEHPEQTIQRSSLMSDIWPNKTITDATLAKQIQRLRDSLGSTSKFEQIITTVHGVGFIFLPEITVTDSETQIDITNQRVKYFNNPLYLVVTFIAVVMIIISTNTFINTNQTQPLTLRQTLVEIQTSMSINKKAFLSQINQRNELGQLLASRFELDENLSWERRFFKYHSIMNAEERFIFAQIRAYTDGPMIENNQNILNLINNNKEILKIIPKANDLRNHLIIWVNKYNKIFMFSEKMCLLYVGVEDGAPYPSAVDNQVINWIKNHPEDI